MFRIPAIAASLLVLCAMAEAQTYYCTGPTTSTDGIPFLTTDPGGPSVTSTAA